MGGGAWLVTDDVCGRCAADNTACCHNRGDPTVFELQLKGLQLLVKSTAPLVWASRIILSRQVFTWCSNSFRASAPTLFRMRYRLNMGRVTSYLLFMFTGTAALV